MYYIWMHYSSPLSWNICIRPMKKEVLTEGELSVATVWGIKQWSLVTIEKNLQILQLFEMERTMEESTTLLVASVFSSFKIGRF